MGNTNLNLEERFRKLAKERVVPKYDTHQEVEVNFFSADSLIEQFASVEYQALDYNARKTGGEVPFTIEEFKAYCNSIVASRIQWVRGERYIYHPNDPIVSPSFLAVICMNIGIAMELTKGITLRPASIPTDVKVFSKKEMEPISFYLASLGNYDGAKGYLKDKSGSWEFMSMQLIDGKIRNENADTHPVYAIMASVVGPLMVNSVLSPLVYYGDITLFEGLLWELTSI